MHSATMKGISGVSKQGSKRQGITGDWRQLSNKELYKSYSSPDNAMIINPGRVRWVYENILYIYIGLWGLGYRSV
jgi:hypothetical protein